MSGFSIDDRWLRTAWVLLCGSLFGLQCSRAEIRTWIHVSGKTIEAEYVSTTLSNEALLEKADGEQMKVSLHDLSTEDLEYIALRHPPKLKIEFSDSSKVDTLPSSERFQSNPSVTEEIVSFKVSIRQVSMKDYPYPLTVEYYAIGYQYLDQDKYVLLDMGKDSFTLDNNNKREVEFATKPMKLPLEFIMYVNHYGFKYSNYLVLVFDQRGELIAHDESKNWLFDHRENLRKLPKGAFFDNTCTRRHASQPVTAY